MARVVKEGEEKEEERGWGNSLVVVSSHDL